MQGLRGRQQHANEQDYFKKPISGSGTNSGECGSLNWSAALSSMSQLGALLDEGTSDNAGT